MNNVKETLNSLYERLINCKEKEISVHIHTSDITIRLSLSSVEILDEIVVSDDSCYIEHEWIVFDINNINNIEYDELEDSYHIECDTTEIFVDFIAA